MDKTKKNGPRCTVCFPQGGRYRGEWHNDQRHGDGCMIYRNGEKYIGQWVDDKREGIGKFYRRVNGAYHLYYTGEWKMDKPSGYGISYDDNGYRYEGQWTEGKRQGLGQVLYGDEQGLPIYEGEWNENQREGRGTERMPNGDIYTGQFHKDLRHGHGTFFFMNKQYRLDGIWFEGTSTNGVYTRFSSVPVSSTSIDLPFLELKHPNELTKSFANVLHS